MNYFLIFDAKAIEILKILHFNRMSDVENSSKVLGGSDRHSLPKLYFRLINAKFDRTTSIWIDDMDPYRYRATFHRQNSQTNFVCEASFFHFIFNSQTFINLFGW